MGELSKKPPTETHRAKTAWADFVKLGTGAEYADLAFEYQRRSNRGQQVPTTSVFTIEHWASVFNWQERLDAIAEEQRIASENYRIAAHHRALQRTNRILDAPGHVPISDLVNVIKATKADAPRGPVDINVRHSGTVNHDHRHEIRRVLDELPDDELAAVETATAIIANHQKRELPA